MKALKLLGILFLILTVNAAYSQGSKKWQRDRRMYFPRAILIQLRSEKKRTDYLEKVGKHKDAEQVRKDALGVNAAMVHDFKDHFNFCPYYFFVDTNIDLLKAGKFDGILLDADMKPVKDPAVNGSSRDYFIVYYGIPEREKLRDNGEMAGRTRFGAGLVVTDYNYIQLDEPDLAYYYSNRGYYHLHRKGVQYDYSSKKYNIEYYALAGQLQDGLKGFFR